MRRITAFVTAILFAASAAAADWPFWGGDVHNTHHAAGETIITPGNVAGLQIEWTYDAGGSVTSIPTVADDVMYFTDWGPAFGGLLEQPPLPGGRLHAVNRLTGHSLWTRHISEYGASMYSNISRSSPAISGDLIFIGENLNQFVVLGFPFLANDEARRALGLPEFTKATVYAINRHTGDLVWKQRIDDHNLSTVTQSPIVYNDTVLVGVSSQEINLGTYKSYDCCNFRGSFVALDAKTGVIKWKSYTVPDNGGERDLFSGGAVWGSTAVVDTVRNRVIFGSGNNYTAPAETRECIRAAGSDASKQRACQQQHPDNLFDSIVALNLDTGAVEWSFTPLTYDAYNTGCNDPTFMVALGKGNDNCPDPHGPDTDFGQGPIFITVEVDGQKQDRIIAPHKSGMLYVLNAEDGSLIWERFVGPAGVGAIGGMEFGSASDGRRVYVANSNSRHYRYEVKAGAEAGADIFGGHWAAYDVISGELLWETPVPAAHLPLTGACTAEGIQRYGIEVCIHYVWGADRGPGFFAWPVGPMTVANGVVYAGVADLEGTMVAMDAASGRILWQYKTGTSINSAPTVVDGRLYWGSGYKYGREGRTVYAFTLPE